MENNNEIHSFIRLVMNEDLGMAQQVIKDALNDKLNVALDQKFEMYAPVLFEKFDPKKADKDDNGEISEWEEKSTEWTKKKKKNKKKS